MTQPTPNARPTQGHDNLQPATASGSRAAWWTSLLIALATAVVLVAIGCAWRGAEVDAEVDRYGTVAEQLWQGHIVPDRFHPFGYPVLIAAVLPLVGDGLRAGCVVSALAAGLLVFAIARLAERLRAGAGVPAACLAAANGCIWMFGTMACSDMTSTAFGIAAIACALGQRRGSAWLAGIMVGLAFACRFPAAWLAPVPCLLLWHRGGWRSALVFVVAAAIGFLPHAVPAMHATGAPLRNDNWHSTYLKVVCHYDVARLQQEYAAGNVTTLSTFLAEHGGEVLALGASDLRRAVTSIVPAMLAGASPAPAALQVWPLLLAVAGLVGAARARGLGLLLLGSAAVLVIASCVTFAPWPRLLLPSVALLLPGVAAVLATAGGHWRGRLALAATLAALAGTGVATYSHFLERQPLAEVARLRQLSRLVGRPMCLLSTMASADRYAAGRTVGYMAPPQVDADAAWRTLRDLMVKAGADVFATGRVTNEPGFALLSNSPIPDDFRLLYRDADTFAVERPAEVTPWIAGFTVAPPTARAGDRVALTLRLAADAPADAVVAGVALQTPGGDTSLLDLPVTGDGTYRAEFTLPAGGGEWRLTPFLMHRNGQVLRGAVGTLQGLD